MTEDEKLRLNLSEKLLTLMLNEKIPFEKKIGNMDYLIRLGADVNEKVYGKSMALWVKEANDENLIKYVEERGGVETEISKEKSEELGRQFWVENGEVKSVKEIKELVLMGANLSAKNDKYKQIWGYLSVEEMNEILKDLPKGYVIKGNVDLREKGLIELPDFSKIKVGGSFYCSYNELTTLEGASSEVGGYFDCSQNKLKVLTGAPSRVGKDFDCGHNQLTTLEGSPENVGGHFACRDNKLTDLTGAPREVGGSFDCRYNQLTDLKGAPREVGGYFDCRKNELTSLKGKPEKIGVEFRIEKEVLARIEETEKKKSDNAVVGFIGNKFEM